MNRRSYLHLALAVIVVILFFVVLGRLGHRMFFPWEMLSPAGQDATAEAMLQLEVPVEVEIPRASHISGPMVRQEIDAGTTPLNVDEVIVDEVIVASGYDCPTLQAYADTVAGLTSDLDEQSFMLGVHNYMHGFCPPGAPAVGSFCLPAHIVTAGVTNAAGLLLYLRDLRATQGWSPEITALALAMTPEEIGDLVAERGQDGLALLWGQQVQVYGQNRWLDNVHRLVLLRADDALNYIAEACEP